MKVSTRTRVTLIAFIAIFGHFHDGWTAPTYSTEFGWWLWHIVNWLRRDVLLVILMWPLIMENAKKEIQLAILTWVVVGLSNLTLHWMLYDLAIYLRFLLN